MKRFIFALVVLTSVFGTFAVTPVLAQRATDTVTPRVETDTPEPTEPSDLEKKDSATPTDFDLNIRLKNPLKVNTITGAIALLVNLVLKIALPFVVIMFIWSGLKFILAQGKKEEITKAKNIFWGTVIGTLLILGAWTITNAIIGTANSLTDAASTPK